MGRTKKDITIAGRTVEEVRTAVQKWFSENSVKVIENTPVYIKGRWGIGLATAPKYFQVSFAQTQGGVVAKTEGWISGLRDQEFSSSAIMGAIPRREGWTAMERLWSMLQNLTRQPSRFCRACGRGIISEDVKFCPHCGNALT